MKSKKKSPSSVKIITLLSVLFLSLTLAGFNSAGRAAALAETPTGNLSPAGILSPADSSLPPAIIYATETITGATATDLALAIGVPEDDLLLADLMGSDSAGVGVGTAFLGNWFPSEGSTFAILSTGLAADAETPDDDDGGYYTRLGGLNNDQGEDLVRLHLRLQVPEDINCASFDFAFYSEEFPEFVGHTFNDAFTAQLNNESISTNGSAVIAPGNFAFDSASNPISVSTVFGYFLGTGTTYDGVTPLLRANTAVTPTETIDIYISIQDMGDSFWDSAVFVDRFFWSADDTCTHGAAADTDGDGLLDEWEENGVTIDDTFIDLPQMGADPMHKDVFVEIDWMNTANRADNHLPDPTALQLVVDAFDNAPTSNPDGATGVHLHLDYGPTAPLTWGAAAEWGALSQAEETPHENHVASCSEGIFHWGDFDEVKQLHFSAAREAIFHYNLWVDKLCAGEPGAGGISRHYLGDDFSRYSPGASDFIVSLGAWPGGNGTPQQQAGTFMHLLGHNLGLQHGGFTNTPWKPNYLSVMNPAFQTRGLIVNGSLGHFDYSSYALPALDENDLDETVGLDFPGSVVDTYGTLYFCGAGNARIDMNTNKIDWNCDGDTSDTSVARNINAGPVWEPDTARTTLATQSDWNRLIFKGGFIGVPGVAIELPTQTEVTELAYEQDASIPPSTTWVDLWVTAPDKIWGPANGGEVAFTISYNNYGQTTATHTRLNAALPAGVSYVSDTSGITPVVNGSALTWDLSSLELTAGNTFTLRLTLPSGNIGTTLSLTFSMVSDQADDIPENDVFISTLILASQHFIPLIMR